MRRKIWLIAAGIITFMFAIFIWRLDIPNWKKLDINKLTQLPNATQVLDADENVIGTLHSGEKRLNISIKDVPLHVQNAFIAAEDLRFYEHHGVDIYRMFGALWNNIKTLSYSQGASTITQQLIKLTHLSSTKTLSRKFQEISLAIKLERRMEKTDILEAYLNVVYFGNSAYGIESAAQTYFDKSASQLTLAEGALLAGIIKAPSVYAPHLNEEKSISRRNAILNVMSDNGFISEKEAADAQNEVLHLATGQDSINKYGWYMDAVLAETESILNLSTDEILSGGFQIITGFNPVLQDAAEQLFENEANFPDSAIDGTPAQAALVALDVYSGEINAVVGGRTYDIRRGLNRGIQIRRQPGSSFKPISVYAAAIDKYGLVPTSIIEDTPRTFQGGYTPGNAGGNTYGKVTLREALSRSLNIATVDLADLIGVQTLRNYAARFGIKLSTQDQNLALALGALTDGVSPAEMGAAYCALANGGISVTAHIVRTIKDMEGNVIYNASSPAQRAVKSSTAYMITDMLKTAATSGSAKALKKCNMCVAGKTGTVSETSGGTRDIWTIAYTPEIAVSVWMGFDNPDSDHSLPAYAGGSGLPAELCADFLLSVQEELSGADFARPSEIKTVLIDKLSLEYEHIARLSTEKTPAEYTIEELFLENSIPQEFSENWTAPSSVKDFELLASEDRIPVLSFIAMDNYAEYVILRRSNEEIREIAVLQGKAGQELRFADITHDIKQTAIYSILPRNALLYKSGILLTGPESDRLQYIPGGIMNKIMGVGATKATQTPQNIEIESNQSLFG